MKASMAKAARTFDALRIKMEAGAPAPVVEAAPVVVEEVKAEAPVAEAEAAQAAPEVVTEAVVEAPAETAAEGSEN
jgi:large subunit ribosomal protein L10